MSLLQYFNEHDKNELVEYYKQANVSSTVMISKTEEIIPRKVEYVLTKLTRFTQMQTILKTGTKIELKSYPQNEEKSNAKCKVKMKWNNINEINGKCDELKKELAAHDLKKCGNKSDLIKRLKNHFNKCSMNPKNNNESIIQLSINDMQSSPMDVDNDGTVIYINEKQYERILRRREIKRNIWNQNVDNSNS
eukprot:314694_1